MAFVFAYSLGADNATSVVDLPLDTLANYKNTAGTNGVTKGDLVFIDATSGLVKRVLQAAGAVAHGVLEGTEFTGLAVGNKYEATNSSYTSEQFSGKFPNGVGKIRRGDFNVYKAPVKAGTTATAANIGKKYALAIDAAGDQTVDVATVTNGVVEVVNFTADGKFVFVKLPSA